MAPLSTTSSFEPSSSPGQLPFAADGDSDWPLHQPTDPGWTDVVCADLDQFLIDHAACERKASALCLSFVVKYADRKALVEPMISLAKEELEHFHQVYKIIAARGLTLAADTKDPYVNYLLKGLRDPPAQRLLDRLVISGLIEARGCERFALLARSLEGGDERNLAGFYHRLARAEAGHYRVFLRVAGHYFSGQQVDEAVRRLADREHEAVTRTPFRPALH